MSNIEPVAVGDGVLMPMEQYTFYTVEPWRFHTATSHRSVPVSPTSTRTQTEGYQGKGKQGRALEKGITPKAPTGHVNHNVPNNIYR